MYLSNYILIIIVVVILCAYRLEELAKPMVRESMDIVQFNPAAFEISKAAMKAIATPRIKELAKPKDKA